MDDSFSTVQFLIEDVCTPYRLDRDSKDEGLLWWPIAAIVKIDKAWKEKQNKKWKCKTKLFLNITSAPKLPNLKTNVKTF